MPAAWTALPASFWTWESKSASHTQGSTAVPIENALGNLADLVSVDDSIDELAREALTEARRLEEIEKSRKQRGPVVAPPPRGIQSK